jgi:hypothetical protein
MACTITSRIAFAAFGILAVGFATLPRFSTRLREAVSRMLAKIRLAAERALPVGPLNRMAED